MDEIAFWVRTKRAPCLMNFDNTIKRQYEEAQNSMLCKSERSVMEVVSSSKKTKRKLSLLEDECCSEKQQNIYFESSQHCRPTLLSSGKSATLESDIDFNIKNSSDKPKRIKTQKHGRTSHKRSKVVTSTPLRRSLRKLHNGASTKDHCNNTYAGYSCDALNKTSVQENTKSDLKVKQSVSKPAIGDTGTEIKIEVSDQPKKEIVINGQYEDMSDVSGFTANYIRSTKLHSASKSHKNLRSKSSRQLVKELQKNIPKNNTTTLICVNKAINATSELPQASVLNCSTDSSQNVLNLVTTKQCDRQAGINKSTSLLKFVGINKAKENGSCIQLDDSGETQNLIGDVTFQSKSTNTSRYPRRTKQFRSKAIPMGSPQPCVMTRSALDKRRKNNKSIIIPSSSDLKENPENSVLSRTRSGRNSALQLHQPEANVVAVYSVRSEETNSPKLNVACGSTDPSKKLKSKRVSSSKFRPKSLMERHSSIILRDSVRERSGYTACFSDSDDDHEVQRQKKFFC